MFRTNVEKAKKKGRAYRCTRCHKMGNQVVDVKYRVADHVLKYHLSLDQVPYYCTLCLFRCSEETQLMQHVLKYKRHLMLTAEKGILDSSPYLVKNPRPYMVGDSDMEAMSQEESHYIFLKSVRSTSATISQPAVEEEVTTEVTTGLDESFDSLEAYVSTLIPPACPSVVEIQSQPRQSDTIVQVSADYLASLMKNQSNTSTSQFPALKPAPILGQPLPPTQELSNFGGKTQPKSSTPINGTPKRIVLRVPGDPFCLPTKVSRTPIQGATISCTSLQSTLNTPKIGLNSVPPTPLLDERSDEENILPQLLDGIETSAPILTPKRTTVSVSTSATQCSLPDETPAWVGIIQTLGKKMVENVDANTRTLRVLEKTTLSMRDTLDNLTRLVRKLSDERAKPTQVSTDEADNDRKRKNSEGHQMKSVLGKAYPESKKPRY